MTAEDGERQQKITASISNNVLKFGKCND